MGPYLLGKPMRPYLNRISTLSQPYLSRIYAVSMPYLCRISGKPIRPYRSRISAVSQPYLRKFFFTDSGTGKMLAYFGAILGEFKVTSK